jgi:hypothetical protein
MGIAATYKTPQQRRSNRRRLPDLRLLFGGRRKSRLRRLSRRCLLLLLTRLLRLLLRQVMTDYAADSRAGNGMVAGNMPRNRANGCAFQAPLGLSCACAEQQSKTRQNRRQHLFHERTHGRTPVACPSGAHLYTPPHGAANSGGSLAVT